MYEDRTQNYDPEIHEEYLNVYTLVEITKIPNFYRAACNADAVL